jgi:hypothetical protein
MQADGWEVCHGAAETHHGHHAILLWREENDGEPEPCTD